MNRLVIGMACVTFSAFGDMTAYQAQEQKLLAEREKLEKELQAIKDGNLKEMWSSGVDPSLPCKKPNRRVSLSRPMIAAKGNLHRPDRLRSVSFGQGYGIGMRSQSLSPDAGRRRFLTRKPLRHHRVGSSGS